jgi:hypothetical protein
VTARDRDVEAVNTRLTQAAADGEDLEVILVLRGRVRRAGGADRWRIRAPGRHVFTFRAESVLAATPVPRPARRG